MRLPDAQGPSGRPRRRRRDVRVRDRERHRARDHGWHDDSLDRSARSSSTSPTAMKVAFYATVATMLFVVAWLASLRVQQLRARASPTTGARTARTSSSAAKTSAPACGCRRCCATRPPGVMHSFIYFGFVCAVHRRRSIREIDHQLPDRFKFLHGQTLPGVLVRRRHRGRRVPRRHRVGDRPPLRRSGRTASASRPSPKTR